MSKVAQLVSLDEMWETVNECMDNVRTNLADDMLSCPMDDLPGDQG